MALHNMSREILEIEIGKIERELRAYRQELENRREDDSFMWGFRGTDGQYVGYETIGEAVDEYNKCHPNDQNGAYRVEMIYRIK